MIKNCELYSTLIQNSEEIATLINKLKFGYCCYCLNTKKILRIISGTPSIPEEKEEVSMEVEFIINKFSHTLNTTYFGYWNVYRVCDDHVWFVYRQLPNMTKLLSVF